MDLFGGSRSGWFGPEGHVSQLTLLAAERFQVFGHISLVSSSITSHKKDLSSFGNLCCARPRNDTASVGTGRLGQVGSSGLGPSTSLKVAENGI